MTKLGRGGTEFRGDLLSECDGQTEAGGGGERKGAAALHGGRVGHRRDEHGLKVNAEEERAFEGRDVHG